MVSVSFQQASYSLSEAVSTPLRVCLQLFGSLEIPVSVILSTQNGTALGEYGRPGGEGGAKGGRRGGEKEEGDGSRAC